MSAPRKPTIKGSDFYTSPSGERPYLNSDQMEGRQQLIFWEEGNPRSVIAMAPDAMKERMRRLPVTLLSMTHRQLKKAYTVSWIDEQLRQAFWDEYFASLDNNRKFMRAEAIYGSSCTKENFWQAVDNPHRLALIVHPPQQYIYKMRSLLEVGLERFAEILDLPLEDRKGQPNVRLIGEMVKIVALIDARVRGAVPQQLNISQQTLSMNVHARASQGGMPYTHQEIDKELRNIEKEIKQLSGAVDTPSMFGDTGANEAIPMDIDAVVGEDEQGEPVTIEAAATKA